MNECKDEHSLLAVVHTAQEFGPAELINCNLSVVLWGFVLENLLWLGLVFFVQSGWVQKWFGWQLKLGQFLAVHTAGGPIPSNLPSSSPSKCPAALSAGRFASPLGKPHKLLTFLLRSRFPLVSYWPRGGGGWPMGLHNLVITKVHSCLCWSPVWVNAAGIWSEESTSNMEKME